MVYYYVFQYSFHSNVAVYYFQYTIPKQLLTRQCLVFDAKDSRIPANSNLIMVRSKIFYLPFQKRSVQLGSIKDT